MYVYVGNRHIHSCCVIIFYIRELLVNRKDWQALALVGLNLENPVLGPLAVQHLNNWLYICEHAPFLNPKDRKHLQKLYEWLISLFWDIFYFLQQTLDSSLQTLGQKRSKASGHNLYHTQPTYLPKKSLVGQWHLGLFILFVINAFGAVYILLKIFFYY